MNGTAVTRRILPLVRKVHLHLGLFLLIQTWLLAFSGLMLNHPRWEISQFWNRRQVETSTHRLVGLAGLPTTGSASGNRSGLTATLQAVMRQLQLDGEPESIRWEGSTGSLSFSVVRPGTIIEVTVDPSGAKAEVKHTATDGAGIVHMLHTFNGVSVDEPSRQRDWFWTAAWTAAMDLLAAALVIWVLSGYLLWYLARQRRLPGLLLSIAGFGILLFFLFGPALLW